MDKDTEIACVCGWEGTVEKLEKKHGFDVCPECGASLSHR